MHTEGIIGNKSTSKYCKALRSITGFRRISLSASGGEGLMSPTYHRNWDFESTSTPCGFVFNTEHYQLVWEGRKWDPTLWLSMQHVELVSGDWMVLKLWKNMGSFILVKPLIFTTWPHVCGLRRTKILIWSPHIEDVFNFI